LFAFANNFHRKTVRFCEQAETKKQVRISRKSKGNPPFLFYKGKKTSQNAGKTLRFLSQKTQKKLRKTAPFL